MNHNRYPARPEVETRLLLSFFGSMLWQDGSLHADERDALGLLAAQLGLPVDDPWLSNLQELPPLPEEVDPQRVPRSLVAAVIGITTLAASVRPSLAKYEALELLESLLVAAPAPLHLELLAA